MSQRLTPVSGEVLQPLSKREADAIETRAHKLWDTFRRTGLQFAAELRRLQDGGAHLTKGYTNFGEYVEATFPDMTMSNAQQLSRMGGALLLLEENNRIDLRNKELPIGATGARALAKVYKDLGKDAALAIYDEAASHGRMVTEDMIAAAVAKLIAPKVEELGPGADEAPTVDPEEDDEDDGYTEDKYPQKVSELMQHIQDLAWDLPESAPDLQRATEQLQAELRGEDTSKDEKWLASKR